MATVNSSHWTNSTGQSLIFTIKTAICAGYTPFSDTTHIMGVSENSVPLNPMANDHYPYYINGYFIGNIPYFQTRPYFKTRMIFWHNICQQIPLRSAHFAGGAKVFSSSFNQRGWNLKPNVAGKSRKIHGGVPSHVLMTPEGRFR